MRFSRRKWRRGHHKAMRQAVDWLREVAGMTIVEGPAPPRCFLPGVWFAGDAIGYDPRHAHVGDLLHEAGHLAVIPAAIRPAMRAGNVLATPEVRAAIADMHEVAIFESLDPGEPVAPDPLYGTVTAGGEEAATAWSYLAAMAAGVDHGRVFDHVKFYTWGEDRKPKPVEGGGAYLRDELDYRRHPGLAMLRRVGMLGTPDNPWRMARWLRD